MIAGVIIDTPPAGNLLSKVFVVSYFDVAVVLSLPVSLPVLVSLPVVFFPSPVGLASLLAITLDELPLLLLSDFPVSFVVLSVVAVFPCGAENDRSNDVARLSIGAAFHFAAASNGCHPDGQAVDTVARNKTDEMKLVGRIATAVERGRRSVTAIPRRFDVSWLNYNNCTLFGILVVLRVPLPTPVPAQI